MSEENPETPQHSQDRIPQPERIIHIHQGNYNESIRGDYYHNNSHFEEKKEKKWTQKYSLN